MNAQSFFYVRRWFQIISGPGQFFRGQKDVVSGLGLRGPFINQLQPRQVVLQQSCGLQFAQAPIHQTNLKRRKIFIYGSDASPRVDEFSPHTDRPSGLAGCVLKERVFLFLNGTGISRYRKHPFDQILVIGPCSGACCPSSKSLIGHMTSESMGASITTGRSS